MGNFKIKKRIFLIIAILTLLLTGISAMTSSYNSAEAAGACSKVGSFMERKSIKSDVSGVASPNESNRKWTVQELFKDSVAYSSFYGEGPGDWFFAEKLNRGEFHPEWDEDAQSRIEESRQGICWLSGMDWSYYGFTLISNGLISFTNYFTMMLIGEDKMGDTLAAIVGGDGSSEGLIGTFLSSFYMPLVVLTVIIMTVTLVYKGLIQMKLREALGAMLWSFGAFVLGVALMLNPQLLASAPQKATSTITSCVLGALSGQNCLSGSVETPSMLTGKECLSSVGGSGANDAETVVNSLNCTIWKSFVLEPWAEQQFGSPYNELYTSNQPDGGKIWTNLPDGQGQKYCVSLSSSDSYATAVNGTPTLNGDEVCNVALYHLFIKTNIKDTKHQAGNNYDDKNVQMSDDTGKYDSRWYDIILPMAKDESKWRNWSGEGMYWAKVGTSVMSLIAIIASSTVLLTLAIFGGAYKIIGVILMAFSPVFLLFAIEPTRGRRIFLGWLETLVSSILKYFAITVLIVIALIMYAGLLSNTTGVTSLVGIIVMTVALHMYRKEIVDLIGASNMGGERLSNKVNEVGAKAGKLAKTTTSAAVGGAIGGAMGQNKARRERVKARKDTIEDLKSKISNATSQEEKDYFEKELAEEEKLKGRDGLIASLPRTAIDGTKGSWESTKRSMKRGTGITANVFQQADRTKADISKRDKGSMKEAAEARKKLSSAFDVRRGNLSEISPEDLSTESIVEETANEKERNVAVNAVRDSQRDKVEYKGELTDVEKDSLNNFADRLSSSINDEELIGLANDDTVMNDPNKKSLVANEINARIKTNSMMNIGSHELGRTGLANEYLSEDELKFNIEMHTENYLETGDERELQKYLSAGREFAERTSREFDANEIESKMRDLKVKVGDDYKRRDNIPTEEELKGKTNYQVELSNGQKVDTGNVSVPEVLLKESKSEDVSKAIKLNGIVQKEKEEKIKAEAQENIPLPDIDKLENDENNAGFENDKKAPESTILPKLNELDNNDKVNPNSGSEGPEVKGPQGPEPKGPQGPEPKGPQGPEPKGPQGPEPKGPQGPEPKGSEGPEPKGPNSTRLDDVDKDMDTIDESLGELDTTENELDNYFDEDDK